MTTHIINPMAVIYIEEGNAKYPHPTLNPLWSEDTKLAWHMGCLQDKGIKGLALYKYENNWCITAGTGSMILSTNFNEAWTALAWLSFGYDTREREEKRNKYA